MFFFLFAHSPGAPVTPRHTVTTLPPSRELPANPHRIREYRTALHWEGQQPTDSPYIFKTFVPPFSNASSLIVVRFVLMLNCLLKLLLN